jgi:hypothetical protein
MCLLFADLPNFSPCISFCCSLTNALFTQWHPKRWHVSHSPIGCLNRHLLSSAHSKCEGEVQDSRIYSLVFCSFHFKNRRFSSRAANAKLTTSGMHAMWTWGRVPVFITHRTIFARNMVKMGRFLAGFCTVLSVRYRTSGATMIVYSPRRFQSNGQTGLSDCC